MALPGINMQSDMNYLIRLVELAAGYKPVRLDVKTDFNALLGAKTTGMRTLTAHGTQVFIDSTITSGHYNYYAPSAPYTAVDATF